MPDQKDKLVKVQGLGVVKFPATMDDTKIAAAIKAHKDQIVSPNEAIPPEVERIESAVGVQYKLGKPVAGSESIASVGEHEPHVIEINDKTRWNQGPKQTKGHEIIHLAFSQMPFSLINAVPKDNPRARYDISNIDNLRKEGRKLWQLPQEQAATIVQQYIADPASRKRLQPWIDDLNSWPFSIFNPTSPSDKTINTTPRTPIPPIEAYIPLSEIKKRAAQLNTTR
jgi:hypothetical protein